jgi:hypothetical protein
MFPLDKFNRHLANDRSDRIYVATESGLVMCLHERGREFARFHMHPDRQPILPEFAPDDGANEQAAPSEDTEASEAMEAAEKGDQPEGDQPDGEMPADEADKPDAEKAEAEDSEMEKSDAAEQETPETEPDDEDAPKKDE